MKNETRSLYVLKDSVRRLPKEHLVFLYRCQPASQEVGLWWTPALFNALNYSLHHQILLLTVLERAELERKLEQKLIEIPEENEYDNLDDGYFKQFIFKTPPQHVVTIDPLAEFKLMFRGYIKAVAGNAKLPEQVENAELELGKKFGAQFLRNFR